MFCQNCNIVNSPQAKFCKSCGVQLIPQSEFICPACTYDCEKPLNFCPICNHKFINARIEETTSKFSLDKQNDFKFKGLMVDKNNGMQKTIIFI
jgi:rRNA maturation endonuclease Nob1